MGVVPFQNEPFSDFSQLEVKQTMEQALLAVEQQLGKSYPLIIRGAERMTEKRSVSYNPAHKTQVVGSVAQADVHIANEAVEAAAEAFQSWRHVQAVDRAGYLFKAAALLRKRKFEFMAWLIYEVGKNWSEADADAAEAIDFLEFYAREMLRLQEDQPLTALAGEWNQLTYIPLGVAVVIPPWNFPLAIMAGMTTAALVTGNTVVLKPASTAAVIAAKFVALMHEAGLPREVLQFVPGAGSEMGDTLIDHPKTRLVAFTGSRDVGIRMQERLAKTAPGQIWLKRFIAELGGKDGIVVDEGADLTAAAAAIVQSAFGFQGQKCSAGSRAIIHQAVYDEVLQLVVQQAGQLSIGDPLENHSIGPVIDEAAERKILAYIEIGKSEGKLVLGGGLAAEQAKQGHYIEPTIFADVAPDAQLMQEEIFGPVLAFCKSQNFEEAVRIYNDTAYGLTGAVFSRNREHIAYAREVMHCGNLYINRKCTGALVGVHPFGGFQMSGTDSKAGGRDYLLLFTQAKVIAERW